MTITFEVTDRFLAAAEEWGERRMMDTEDALETKVEQALLEIEHLVSGATEVAFEVEDRTVRFDPTDDLASLLETQAEEAGVEVDTLLRLHVDLFARVFLDEGDERPPNAPPR